MHEQIGKILTEADAVLLRTSKIESAIQDEVAGLASLIANRLQSDRDFRKLECQAAIGDPAPGLAAAKKLAGEAKSALESASLRLNGFRGAWGEMGGDFVGCYDTLAGALPAHNARVVSAFEAEWQAALTTWNRVLGRRHAIEGVLKQSLDLPEPVPAEVQIDADVSRPSETLAALTVAIKSIAGSKALAERPVAPGYNPMGVYRVTSDRMERQGISRGAFVVDASFRPGELARLVAFSEARAVLARDVEPGVLAAATKAAEIDKAARDREWEASERRLHGGPDNSSARRLDLETEYNYQPSKADLAKSAADIAAGIAAGVEERERQRVIDQSLQEAADRDAARATKSAEQKTLRQGPSAGPKLEWPEALH